MRAKDCRGFKAGIIYSTDQQGSIDYTDGVLPPGTKLAGGWAEVHRDGWAFPLRVEVSLQEYIAKKNDGTPNRMWAEKPATMIRKIALVQALREAFPEDLAGMYSPEELESGGDLPHTPIPIADYIDLSSQAKAHTGPEKATTHSPPPRIEEARRRSRRNKWQVDKAVFGDEQLQTCGSTPDQLLALREILRGQDTVSAGRIKKYLAEIGYSELSYLTSEEADSLMNNAQAKWFDSMPPIEPEATANGSDAVQCPLSHDTKVYRSFCNSECETRKMDGWCVALGEAPPEDEELI
jgi:hypothetical protein